MGSIPTGQEGKVLVIARPRKNVTALQGDYSKEDMQGRLKHEKRLKGNSDKIIAPDFITYDEVAMMKFNQLVEELKASEVISNVDVDLLAVYCDCYSKYVQATKMLHIQELVKIKENKLSTLTKVNNK